MRAALANVEFPAKLAPLFRPKRYKVLKGGRGGAKSWGIGRALIAQAIATAAAIASAVAGGLAWLAKYGVGMPR